MEINEAKEKINARKRKHIVIPLVIVTTIIIITVTVLFGPILINNISNNYNTDYPLSSEHDIDISNIGAYYNYMLVITKIELTQDVDTQNARMLYECLLSKDCLSNKEKIELAKYIQYFIDNKYLDVKKVHKKLHSFTVTDNDPTLIDEGLGATYNEDNSITFADESYREVLLSHELHHTIENEKLDYIDYAWFCEGFTCLVTAEYFNAIGSENAKTFFVRALADFVGTDILFQVSAKGDINILVSALLDRGISESDINKLFGMFKKYNDDETFNPHTPIETKVEIAEFIVDLYCSYCADNYFELPDSLYQTITAFLNDSEDFDYVYLDSTHKDFDETFCVTLEEVEATIEKAKKLKK